MGQFKLLFSISVDHLFFSDRVCKDLEFIPTDSCKKIIKKTGVIVRKDIKGIQIFYDETKTDVLLLYADDLHDPLNFCFKVYSKDPCFLNYTDLPPLKEDSILNLDNTRVENKSSGEITLNQGKYVSKKDIEKISSQSIKQILSRRDRLIKPLFVLNISAKNKNIYLFDKQMKVLPKRYIIKFKNRKTYWKYYLLNELNKEDLYINDLNHKIEFEKLHDEDLPGHGSVLVFKSKIPIPLLEKSDYHFQLKEKNQGNGKVLIKRLAVASAHQIFKEKKRNSKTAVSEIFVNY